MSTPTPPPPDTEDLRGLARNLPLLLEIGVRTLSEDAGHSELALRVTGHLGCELSSVVPVTERFPKWEHVNIQRGIDACSYGTVAIGPEENTEVVTFGLVTATAPDGSPVVIGVRDESQFGPPLCSLEILAADRSAAAATRAEIERLLQARDDFAAGRITAADLRSVEDQEIPKAVRMQEEVGLQSATDGEFRRASWHMDFIYALSGISKAPGNMAVKFRNPSGTIEWTPAGLHVGSKVRLDDTIFGDVKSRVPRRS